MTNRKPTTSPTKADLRARNVKLAEGGIIFTLVLGLCVFLGIRFAHEDGIEPVAVEIAPAATVVLEEPAVTPAVEPATIGGTEPAEVVVADTSGSGPLTMQDVLPDVPVFVTYSSAEDAYLTGRYGEARDMFAEYLDTHPENAWGHYMHGLSLWKTGRNADAVGAFDEALRLEPEHLKSLVNRARAQLNLEQPDAALATIQRALDVAPDHIEARRVLGRSYHNLGRLEEAVTAYRGALELRADDAWTLNNLALVWIEQDQCERALEPLARAVQLRADVAVIHNNLGTALERTGHQSQALEQFELAASLGSDRGESNHARLDEVTIPADDPAVDLSILAAAWVAPDPVDDPAEIATETVAVMTFDDANSESTNER